VQVSLMRGSLVCRVEESRDGDAVAPCLDRIPEPGETPE